jgi:ribonuclease PH
MAVYRRHDGRRADELRPVEITRGFVRTAHGSCLIAMGGTRVICTASFVPGVPRWREESQLGWVTAEYGMLPASTRSRKPRPLVARDGRSVEIQRVIGRVLRNVVRFDRLGRNTIYLDCDVLEADGGTRTASITGAWVALDEAVGWGAAEGLCRQDVLTGAVAAVSVGIVEARALLDLDYAEDAAAEVDMNVAMTGGGKFAEIQGSSEGGPFGPDPLQEMLDLARKGIRRLIRLQRAVRKKGKTR